MSELLPYVGHDLDGLIIDIEETKRELILAHFGVRITGKVGKSIVAKAAGKDPKDPVFVETYESFQRALYNDPVVNDQMPPVNGALVEIRRLRDFGVPQVVITARTGPAVQYGKDWLNARNLSWLPYVAVGREEGAKAVECQQRGVRCYTDDDLPVVKSLEENSKVPHLYLFSTDPADVVAATSRIIKVAHWAELGDLLHGNFGGN